MARKEQQRFPVRRSDASLLCAVLGADDSREPALAVRLEELGGVLGLWKAGPAALDDLLGAHERDRFTLLAELADRLVAAPAPAREIDSAAAVAAHFQPRLALESVESFWVLLLDARGKPLATTRIAQGTLTACLVHPREVFAPALRARAASIVVVHNHPSGDPTPSDEDEVLTSRLARAGELLGIPLLDHVIIARGGHRSLGPREPSRAQNPKKPRSARA